MKQDFQQGQAFAIEPEILRAKREKLLHRHAASRFVIADSAHLAGWYVVSVVAGYEAPVRDAMKSEQIDCWLPMRKERRCARRRRANGKPVMRDIDVAAFTGYIFVRCVPSAMAWHGIASFDGVLEILGSDSRPAVLSDGAMGDLMMLIEKRALDFSTGRNQFAPGDTVVFKAGAMAEHKGTVAESYSGWGIVPVLVDLFGRKTVTLAPVDSLEKLA